MKPLVLCALIPICLLIASCRSSEAERSDPEGARAANAKPASARGNPNAQTASALAAQAGGATSPGSTSGRAADREEAEAQGTPPDHYEGGDAALLTAPIHRGGASSTEKVEERPRSTPTPTPHGPMYQPLDASGKPTNPQG